MKGKNANLIFFHIILCKYICANASQEKFFLFYKHMIEFSLKRRFHEFIFLTSIILHINRMGKKIQIKLCFAYWSDSIFFNISEKKILSKGKCSSDRAEEPRRPFDRQFRTPIGTLSQIDSSVLSLL